MDDVNEEQAEVDQEQALSALEEAIGDRGQELTDREQARLDAEQRRLDGDRLALGEEVAQSIGDDPARTRMVVIAATAIGVGACVSICGAIGFVGLVAPVIARAWTGHHPGQALWPAAALGAALLLGADLLVRLAPLGRTLPVGVVTTLVGAPIFVWLVTGTRTRIAA